ncbi:MAG: copper homeostasis protein CutC [Terracidiphilus sp.]|jgi:copper homeostasis protein
MKSFLFELCAETLPVAQIAQSAGADRVELCSQLKVGGLTADLALVSAVVGKLSVPIYALIRPRGGDFVYSPAEFEQMRRQIEQMKEIGVAGVVAGVLLPDGRVDLTRSRELVELARPLEFTFNRAFDETPDLDEALEAVIATGADWLLTSGGEPDLQKGVDAIARLVRKSTGRIGVIAGGGLRLTEMEMVLRRSGVRSLHGSLTREAHDSNSTDPLKALEATVRSAVQKMSAVYASL